jgi:hypothetical protein
MPRLGIGVIVVISALLQPACGSKGGGSGIPAAALPSGGFDPGFGTGGVVLGNPAGSAGQAFSIAIDSTWMYVAGTENTGGGQWRIEKRNLADGSLDPGFGAAGVVISNPTANGDFPRAIVIDGGSLYIGGVQNVAADPAWRIEKRNASNGAPDAVFGSGTGAITVNPSTTWDNLFGLAVSGGALFAVGYEGNPAPPGTDEQWRIEKRSATTGALDGVFGGGTGIVRSNPGVGQDETNAIVLDSTSIYVAGYQNVSGGDYGWRVEKRDRSTGAFDGVFGSGTGAITSNPGSGRDDEATCLILAGPSLFVAGFHEFSLVSDREWRIEKRDAGTGSLDPAFGGGSGFVTTNVGTVNESPFGLAWDGTDLYVGGWTETNPILDLAWRIERRDPATGSMVPSFGGGGFVTSDPTSSQDQLYGIAVDASFVYAVGLQSDGPGTRWRIEKRAK